MVARLGPESERAAVGAIGPPPPPGNLARRRHNSHPTRSWLLYNSHNFQPTMAPPAAPAAAATNGVLPVPVAVLQKNNNNNNKSDSPARGSSNRSNAPRLKVVVRRLAPGLTQKEFEVALGEEWKLGGGKIDWFCYKPGKISKECAAPIYAFRLGQKR